MEITIEEYVHYRAKGFLVKRSVLSGTEVEELLAHVDAAYGHELRIHMLHRKLPIHERYLRHPELLDVVAALVGPDVLALQTMLFVKPPGAPGQGHHQDSYHIITQPDTLIGAWVALDRADAENGCLWISPGSQSEPVYPDADETRNHGGHLTALVLRRHSRQVVAAFVRVVGARDRGDAGQQAVATVAGELVDVRVDGLVLGAGCDPQAAVLLVGAVERQPGPDQGVGPGEDVKRVLVVPLALRSWTLDEQHRLQRQHVGAHERLHHVEHAGVKQEALVDLEPAVQHVDPHVDPSGEHVVDVAQQLVHLVGADQAANDQITLAAEAHVLLYRDSG